MLYVPTSEPGIGPIARAAFPSNRKPVAVEEFRGPVNVNSYWDGGSRDIYVLVHVATHQRVQLPETHPAYTRRADGSPAGILELRELPPDVALVSGGTFCGKPATVRVHLRPDNLAAMLPAANPDLSEPERKALDVIAGIKGSYRQSEFERRSLGDYSATNPHVQALAARGFVKVNKAGAVSVTIEGRNARLAS